jgi:uncharacterized protein
MLPPAGITSTSMPQSVLIDAGPIVAFLRDQDEYHDWSVGQFQRFPSFTTCDAVLAEACARMEYYGRNDQSRVVELLLSGALRIEFDSNQSADRVLRLMRKYADLPMDFADACLVVMSERVKNCTVVTLDRRDFSVYRRREREAIPFISPRN